jgi:hypothetical protein
VPKGLEKYVFIVVEEDGEIVVWLQSRDVGDIKGKRQFW